jgi:hypothetical protein
MHLARVQRVSGENVDETAAPPSRYSWLDFRDERDRLRTRAIAAATGPEATRYIVLASIWLSFGLATLTMLILGGLALERGLRRGPDPTYADMAPYLFAFAVLFGLFIVAGTRLVNGAVARTAERKFGLPALAAEPDDLRLLKRILRPLDLLGGLSFLAFGSVAVLMWNSTH